MVKKCFLSELGNLEAANCIWFSFFLHVYFIWLCSLTLLGITVCPPFFHFLIFDFGKFASYKNYLLHNACVYL